MGGGASKEEKLDGTAITGKYGKRIEMPPGTVGEQMKGGMYPGEKFLKFTPRNLQLLNEKKGTTALYLEMSKVIVEDGGGKNMTGWESKKIHEIIARFQAQFNEKGIAVTYNKVRWWVSHGDKGGHHEYRYWMTFSDMDPAISTAQGTLVSTDAFDPNKDYEKMDPDEDKLFTSDGAFVVVGTVVEGKFSAFDPTGTWVADMSTATGDIKKWMTSMEFTATKEGNIYKAAGKYKMSALCLWLSGKFSMTMQPIPGKTDTFTCITNEGEYLEAVLSDPDTFTSTETSRRKPDTVVWRRTK